MRAKVTMDGNGAITLPWAILHALGLEANDELTVEHTAEGVLLRTSRTLQVENYSEERIAEFARDENAIGALLRKRI